MAELKAADGVSVEEEYGDLLFCVVTLGRHLKLTPEIALSNATEKFIRRFEKMEAMAKNNSKELNGLSAKELDELWEMAKKA
ncbi:MAG: NTP pyrophosphohydrolase [Clostridia bacterium]|nr:NTP pyrophosphohydrolase [Clostridia bacterium]